MKNAYFKAAGQRGIPCAFIVGKDQHVEWIGHPMGMDDPLESVVKDTWDRQAFKTKWDESKSAEAKLEKLQKAYMTAMQNENWNEAVTAIDKIIALGDQYAGMKPQKFMILAKELGDYDRAYAFADEVIEDAWDNAQMLNQIAWFIVDEAGLERRDYDRSMKAAKRANELTEGKDGAILDTVARIYYEKGDLETALVYQRKAVKAAENDTNYANLLPQLREWLEKYEKESKKY
ncbi:MAG: hypothetical protein ACYTGC_20455 [Planctomycetota bacterium]